MFFDDSVDPLSEVHFDLVVDLVDIRLNYCVIRHIEIKSLEIVLDPSNLAKNRLLVVVEFNQIVRVHIPDNACDSFFKLFHLIAQFVLLMQDFVPNFI